MTATILEKEKEFSIDVPMSANEIKFSNFCVFKELDKQFIESMRNGNQSEAILKHKEVLDSICEIPDDVYNFLPYALKDVEFQEHANHLALGVEPTILGIYLHVIKTLNEYKPTNLDWFEIDGEKYIFSVEGLRKTLIGEGGLTSGELIEMLNLQLRFEKMQKSGGQAMENAQVNFDLGLREMAILMRKKDELLPSNLNELNTFINDRAKLFENVTMNHILNVGFFLNTLLILSIREKTAFISSTLPRAAKRRILKIEKKKEKGKK